MESTDSGQGDDFHIALSFAFHFIYQGSHAIDTCIARTDDADCFALFGVFESLFGTNPFALHSGVDTFGIRTDKVTDKTKIILVSHHYICFTHGSEHRRGNILFTSRPDAGYDYLGLFHNCNGFEYYSPQRTQRAQSFNLLFIWMFKRKIFSASSVSSVVNLIHFLFLI